MAIPPPVSLSAPYTLFPLAPSLAGTIRREDHVRPCLTSVVESPSSKKRKRGLAEIVTAVDGEGVNIYDVSSTQIISSYATPASTQFSCTPASVRSPAFTRTYAAVSHPKKQILCWAQSKTEGADAEEGISSFSKATDTNSDVVFLKSLARVKKSKSKGTTTLEGDILAVFSDSQVKCFSADLASEKWAYKPDSGKIVFATTTTAAIAKKTILSNRPDVLLWNSISPVDDTDTEELVLLTISSKGDISLHSILISAKLTTNRKPAHHLLTITVPSLSPASGKAIPVFTIHFATGTLHCLIDGRLMTFSLLTTTPSVQSIIPLCEFEETATSATNKPSPYSLVCISSTMVLVSTPSELSLYETKYSSLQATLNLTSDSPATALAPKGLHLSVFIDKMDLAVGHSVDGIIAVQLARPPKSARHPVSTGLLINSICRGVEDLSMLPASSSMRKEKGKAGKKKGIDAISDFLEAEEKEQMAILERLLRYREDLDVEGFEAEFAKYVWVQRDPVQIEIYKQWKETVEKPSEQLTNGVNSHEEHGKEAPAASVTSPNAPELPEFLTPQSQAWKRIKGENPGMNFMRMEENFRWRPLSEQFITSVLSLIFELKADGNGLEIGFFPTNVIKYLVESGGFSPMMLRVAEGQQKEDRSKVNQKEGLVNGITHTTAREVGQGGLVSCLVEYDPSLTHLAWFLRETGDMEIGEVIAAIKVVLGRINGSQQAFLSNPALDEDDEARLQRLTYEAELALQRASEALEDTAVLEEVLRLSMRRLNKFPSEAVVRGFRIGLEGDELMGLIRILRREIVVDRVGDDSDQLHDEEAIFGEQGTFEAADVELICEILTCALDAVGVAGLILANDTVVGHHLSGMSIGIDGELELDADEDALFDSQEGNQLLISSLHSEVTHTVSALQESAALSGLIAELIRHAGGLKAIKEQQAEEKAKKSRVGKLAKRGKAHEAAKVPAKKIDEPVRPALTKKHPAILQIPVHDKYMRNRRIQRRDSVLPARLHHFIPDKQLKAKLLAAGLSIPASLLLKEELREQRRLLKANKRAIRSQEKQKMLPLGLPPPARMGLGALWEKGEASGEVRLKSARRMAEEGSKLVGMYSLEKWVV
ncbi:hypothetical protein EV426DRAFT_62656 [Tirmania nivea]|nr:hypothetical protein EV426DRAFT_62656 [Tirmania nivea]